MNLKKTTIILAMTCALALATVGSGFAQDATTPIITIENGYFGGYKMSTSNIGSALAFAIDFNLSDKLLAKMAFIQGDAIFDSYRLFGLSYAFLPKLNFTTLLGLGTASGNVVGLDMDYIFLTHAVAGSLQSCLKLSLGYLAPVTSYGSGLIHFGIAATIGF